MPVLPALAATLGAMIGIAHFWVNDDVGNLLRLSGGFTGVPESLNTNLGPIFSTLVATLYRLTTKVAWYPVILLAIPTVSSSWCLRKLYRRIAMSSYVAIAILMTSGMFLLGIKINFTLSSFIACSASVFLVAIAVSSNELRIREVVAAIVLSVMALSIRMPWTTSSPPMPPAFLFVALLNLILFTFSEIPRKLERIVKFSGLLGIVFLVAWLPQLVIMSLDSEWRDFVEFNQVRGSLNGNESLVHYLNSISPAELLARTGIDEAAMWELRQWSLFDSESVPTENLRKLSLEVATFRWRMISADFITQFSSFAASYFGKVAWVVVATMIFRLAEEKMSFRSWIRWSLVRCVLLLSSFGLIYFITSGVRFPSYVLVGTVFATSFALTLDNSLDSSDMSVKPFVRWPLSVIALVLIVAGCWLNFGQYAKINREDVNSKAKKYREIIKETRESNRPVILGTAAGKAYQYSPFDVSVPTEYLQSKDFSGGASIRSPQHVRRWNYITGEQQVPSTLFDSQLYDNVYFYNRIYSQLFQLRKPCYKVLPVTLGYFEKSSVPCDALRVIDAGGSHQIDHWFSGPQGFELQVTRNIDQVDLRLISPFGAFARSHLTRIRVNSEDGGSKLDFLKVVTPGIGTEITMQDLSENDRILIQSVSSCVVPFDVDPIAFPDRSVLCVGLNSIRIDGQSINIVDLP